MTDGLDQALAQAGLDLLIADATLVVLDGEVPDGTQPPYVLVYTTIEWRPSPQHDGLDGIARSPEVHWYCHCVGATAAAARAIGQRVRTQLLNARPVIAGLNLGQIEHVQGLPPVRDELTGVLVMDAVNIYTLTARH